MRILIVTQRYHPLIGGAERALRELARAFAARGHCVRVIAARFEKSWPRIERVDGVPVERVPLPALRWVGTGVFIVSLIRRLQSLASEADIVYVSMLKHAAWAALQARSLTGLPVVLRAEGAGETGDVAWQTQALFGRAIARTCRKADAIIAVSGAVREELLRAGYPKTKVDHIPNAVDCSFFRPPSEEERLRARELLGIEGPAAVYVGRISPEKGVGILAEAWPDVRERVGGATLLVVGGPVDSPLATRLAHRAGVRFIGETSEVRRILHAADVFVLPSRFEGVSLALLEAMACGLAPVVTDIPGNREAVGEGGEAGVLVAQQSPEALAEAISELLLAPERRAQIGAAARRRVEDVFSLDRSVERHLELFEQLTGASPGRVPARGKGPRASP